MKTKTSTKEKTTINKCLISIMLAGSFISAEIGVIRYLFPSIFDIKNVLGGLSVFMTTMIFYPVAEELITRGMLLNYLTKKYSFPLSNIIQAIIFSCMHLNIHMFIFFLFFSVVLGLVKKYIGISCAIIIHMLHNLTVYLLGIQILKLPNIPRYNYLLIGVGLSVVMTYTLINLKRLDNGKKVMNIKDD